LAAANSSMTARLALERAVMAGTPPIDLAHASASNASSTAIIEGVLMVSPLKIDACVGTLVARGKGVGDKRCV